MIKPEEIALVLLDSIESDLERIVYQIDDSDEFQKNHPRQAECIEKIREAFLVL